MTIDREKIAEAFPVKAWAYAEQLDSVKIGKWDGKDFRFYEPLNEKYLVELRILDENRELKFTEGKYRDTSSYDSAEFIPDLADARYYMYGEHADHIGEITKLWEDRGGAIYFPAKLKFPNNKIALKLGIKIYVRYNPVAVLPIDVAYDYGLSKSGAGALEVIDYAYTGFFYANDKAVEL